MELLLHIFRLASLFATALHETAHAVVARAFGARLRVVRIGHGRVHLLTRVAGVRVEVRAGAWHHAGGVVHHDPPKCWTRWHYVAVSAAGPLVELVWIVMLFVLTRRSFVFWPFFVLAVPSFLHGIRDDVEDIVCEMESQPEVTP